MSARNDLPSRRPAETAAFERGGSHYRMTVGYFPDGRVGEIFDVLASDAAILASLALQHGCALETITHALKRDSRGEMASPIGAALERITP